MQIIIMKAPKAMTIRLDADQANALEIVASIEDRPVSEIIREAIAEHIESRKKDRGFKQGLKDRIVQAQRMLGSDL